MGGARRNVRNQRRRKRAFGQNLEIAKRRLRFFRDLRLGAEAEDWSGTERSLLRRLDTRARCAVRAAFASAARIHFRIYGRRAEVPT